MLAALVNGLLLVAVAIAIAIAAIGRLGDPPAIDGAGVLALGLLGLAGNVAATLVLARGEREDINLEGVLRHSAADALGSLGVVIAGAVVLAGGWTIVDPIVSLLIAVLDPRLLLAADQGAVRRADGGGAGGPRRRGNGRRDLRGGGRALGPRPARLDGDRRASARSPRTSSSPSGADRDLIRRRLELLAHERFGIDHTTLQMEEEADRGPAGSREGAARGLIASADCTCDEARAGEFAARLASSADAPRIALPWRLSSPPRRRSSRCSLPAPPRRPQTSSPSSKPRKRSSPKCANARAS